MSVTITVIMRFEFENLYKKVAGENFWLVR